MHPDFVLHQAAALEDAVGDSVTLRSDYAQEHNVGDIQLRDRQILI